MSALDHFSSVDNLITNIKKDFAGELEDMRHMRDAAVTELTIVKDHLKQAIDDKDSAVRIAIKLVTQFGMVEKIFAEAKALALQVEKNNMTTPPETKQEPAPAPSPTPVTSPQAVTTATPAPAPSSPPMSPALAALASTLPNPTKPSPKQ